MRVPPASAIATLSRLHEFKYNLSPTHSPSNKHAHPTTQLRSNLPIGVVGQSHLLQEHVLYITRLLETFTRKNR